MAGVLDYVRAVRAGNFRDRGHVACEAGEVHRNDCFDVFAAAKRIAQPLRIEIKGFGIHVREYGPRSDVQCAVRASKKRVRRSDERIAGAELQGEARKMQRGGTVATETA